jgi:pimeloyl-ACP methyl ester carboxylesterase
VSRAALSSRVREWRSAGELIDADGRAVFVRPQSGEGTAILFLHGYPSSSYDWAGVLAQLPDRRAVCFDFLGFGLSSKPRDHTYSLFRQADLAEAVVARELPDQAVLLVAHDMGTSVATELLARDVDGTLPFELAGVLLLNGSMVLEAASLTLAQKVLRSRLGPVAARLTSERGFRMQFARLFSDDHPLTDEEGANQWALLTHDGGDRIIDRLTYYLHERVEFASRWHGALRDWEGDLRLAWAMRDPVCTSRVLDAVTALRPAAPVRRLERLGHYPQIEEPDTIAAIVAEQC